MTGTKSYSEADVRTAVAAVKKKSGLPCAVGFGIKTAEQAQAVAKFADAVVVGSAIVNRAADAVQQKRSAETVIGDTIAFCRSLAESVHAARDALMVE